ncbi:MAG: hypothetical protein JWR58_2162, partial [Pseudonocardia sp.]|nr:hypothetical protein [Pseudonocardia sp.]
TASGYAPVAQLVHVTAGAQASTVVELGAPAPAASPSTAPPGEPRSDTFDAFDAFDAFDSGGMR